MNLSALDFIVISVALVAPIGIAYFFVVAVQDGHRGLQGAAAVAFFAFILVAAVFFLRAA